MRPTTRRVVVAETPGPAIDEPRPQPQRPTANGSGDSQSVNPDLPASRGGETTGQDGNERAASGVTVANGRPEMERGKIVATTEKVESGTGKAKGDFEQAAYRSTSGRVARLAAVLMVVVAFVCGATLASLVAFWRWPVAPLVFESGAGAELPSPYAALAGLADHSPSGLPVTKDWVGLLNASRTATDAKEKVFWINWATRKLLSSRDSGAAAILSDFASNLANNEQLAKPGRYAAAQFLWEMAAIADDCVAMDNIAIVLSRDSTPAATAAAGNWHARAVHCHQQNP